MQWLDNYGDTQYDGHAVQKWLANNVDICAYIAAAYLAFVFKGPVLVDFLFRGHPPTRLIKMCWALWNVGLAVFSMYGVLRVGPPLIRNFKNYSLHDTLCTFRDDEFYTTKVGFAIGLFSFSKVPEFGDTFFLILSGKRTLPFLSWFHHVTTFLFAWMAYQQGSSIFICAAAMNYFVHSIMYTYFAFAEAGFKNLVKPLAKYITVLQITQMVVGLLISSYVVYQHVIHGESACIGTTMSGGRTQLVVYIFNFYLFSEMFVKNYVFPRKAPAASPAATAKKSK